MPAAIVYGISYGFAQAIIFIGYAATFIFGAWQSIQPINDTYFARFENIYTVFMALIFGTLALGQANSFAPSYSKAKQAARRVFALLDRKSSIDSSSDNGIRPVSTFIGSACVHYSSRSVVTDQVGTSHDCVDS